MERKRREQTLMNLAKAKRSVRSKLQALRNEQFATEHAVRQSLTPVIAPLEKATVLQSDIKDISKASKREMQMLRERMEELGAEPPYEKEDWDAEEEDEEDQGATGTFKHPSKFVDVAANVSPQKSPDNEYGPKVDENGLNYTLGSEAYSKTPYYINVGGKVFARTPGLVDMIENEKPQWDDSTDADKLNYQAILNFANPHKYAYEADRNVRVTQTYKYHFIRMIMDFDPRNPPPSPPLTRSATARAKKGTGLLACGKRRPRTRLPRNPNDLVERLRLLSASKGAGHTGHESEIQRIVKTLRRRGFIE